MLKYRFSSKRILLPLFVLAAIAILGTVIVVAQEGEKEKVEPNVKTRGILPSDSPETQAVSDIALALQLARYGQRVKSASALALAAQILLDNPTQELQAKEEEEKSDEETPVTEPVKEDKGEPLTEPAKILAAAESMNPDEATLAWIKRLQSRSPKTRGRVGGTRRFTTEVLAGDTDVFIDSFRAGERAIVTVVGDGDTDLDLYVYDEHNSLIGSDTG